MLLCILPLLQIIVPMPSFDSQTKKPWAKTPKEKEKVSYYLQLSCSNSWCIDCPYFINNGVIFQNRMQYNTYIASYVIADNCLQVWKQRLRRK